MWPRWGPFGVTLVLLIIVMVQLERGDTLALAGSVIGYVAGYWLPTRAVPPTDDPPA